VTTTMTSVLAKLDRCFAQHGLRSTLRCTRPREIEWTRTSATHWFKKGA